jgi:tetrahydromethanopterin S-methyltransferase subunit G
VVEFTICATLRLLEIGDFDTMAEYVTRDEFTQLGTRVDVVEREVEGEKMVTRHILEQTRHNSDDLAAIKSRLDRLEQRFDGLDRKGDGLDRKIDNVDLKVTRLTRDLPTIVAGVMREVLRERDENGRS